ncbi:MAG: hypothetical protein ACKO4S_14830 [Snowella sp.]
MITREKQYEDGTVKFIGLILEVNDKLNKIANHGKKVKISHKNRYITIQFSHPTIKTDNGKKQQIVKSIGKQSMEAVFKAEEIATKIIEALHSGTYSDEWLAKLLDKPYVEKVKTSKETLTFEDAYLVLKKDFDRRGQNVKNSKSRYHKSFRYFEQWEKLNDTLTPDKVKTFFESFDGEMRIRHLCEFKRLILLLELSAEYELLIENLKEDVTLIRKNSHCPGDKEIVETYLEIYEKSQQLNDEDYKKRKKWLNVYAILAIYGLRPHEIHHILNWDSPIVIRNNEFIIIENPESNAEPININQDSYIPAITDENNQDKILVISGGKTGKRIAIPFIPKNSNWFEIFKIFDIPFNNLLPEITNPLEYSKYGKYKFTSAVTLWFKRNISFTAYKLRHACNIRMHQAGLNHLTIANSLGHTLAVNQSVYLRHQELESKVVGFKNSLTEFNKNENEIEYLKLENRKLWEENKYLKLELDKYTA